MPGTRAAGSIGPPKDHKPITAPATMPAPIIHQAIRMLVRPRPMTAGPRSSFVALAVLVIIMALCLHLRCQAMGMPRANDLRKYRRLRWLGE